MPHISGLPLREVNKISLLACAVSHDPIYYTDLKVFLGHKKIKPALLWRCLVTHSSLTFVLLFPQLAAMCYYPWCCRSWAWHWPVWPMGLMMRGEIAWSCSTTFWRCSAGTMWWGTHTSLFSKTHSLHTHLSLHSAALFRHTQLWTTHWEMHWEHSEISLTKLEHFVQVGIGTKSTIILSLHLRKDTHFCFTPSSSSSSSI